MAKDVSLAGEPGESCLPCHGEALAELGRCGGRHVYRNHALRKDVERTFGGTR